MDYKSTVTNGKSQSQTMRNYMNPLTKQQCIEKGNCQVVGMRETVMMVSLQGITREILCGDGQIDLC